MPTPPFLIELILKADFKANRYSKAEFGGKFPPVYLWLFWFS